LMPGTASDVADPFKNLRAGASFLADQYKTASGAPTSEDRWKLAATAYTAGPGTVQVAQGIIQGAPSDSPWYGRNPNTYSGLTGPDTATCLSPLSVAAETTLSKSQEDARDYVNKKVVPYINNIGYWLRRMRP